MALARARLRSQRGDLPRTRTSRALQFVRQRGRATQKRQPGPAPAEEVTTGLLFLRMSFCPCAIRRLGSPVHMRFFCSIAKSPAPRLTSNKSPPTMAVVETERRISRVSQ